MLRKIKILAKVIYQEFWEWNNNLSQLKSELLQYGNYLENGKYEWLIMSSSLILVKHVRIENIPETLQTTLTEFWKKPKDKNFNKRFIVKIREALASIRNVFRRNGYLTISSNFHNENMDINAQIALLRSNGKMLLFDVDKDLVYIKFAQNSSTNANKFKQLEGQWDYSMMKQEIGRYFALPIEKKIIDCFYQQDLVHGIAFSDCSSSERLQVIKEICNSSRKMAENFVFTPKITAFDIMKEGFSLGLLNVNQPEMLEYISSRQEAILMLSKNWKIIPSHCDLTAHNLTILDKHPVLLDLAPHKVGFLPPFFVPMCLIHSEVKEYDRLDLVEAFLDGKLDFEFSFLSGLEKNSFDKDMRIDLLLSETLALAATGNKISPQNIQYWFKPIFDLVQN